MSYAEYRYGWIDPRKESWRCEVSYQVNFKLFVPECEYWETEIITNMQRELHEAAMLVFERNGLHNKQVGLSSAEVSFLVK